MWDALIAIAQHALTTDLPPTSHGARPRVCVITHLEDLREDLRDHYRAKTRNHPDQTDGRPDRPGRPGRQPDQADPAAQPDPSEQPDRPEPAKEPNEEQPSGGDPAQAPPPSDPSPSPSPAPAAPSGDETPVQFPDEPHHPGPVTEDGLTLTAAATRRLACDADIIPLVLGSQGQVLDVGRTQRLVTMTIWLALIARDHHCTFPGCTRPPLMCHAHHIRHWADGGPTSLANLVMLCGHHHRTIHDTPWDVRLNPHDHLPEFLPPPPRHGSDDGPTVRDWVRHRPRHE